VGALMTFTELIGDPIIAWIDNRSGISVFCNPRLIDVGGMLAVVILEHIFDATYAVEKKTFGWLW
jgi:hypothetical protein